MLQISLDRSITKIRHELEVERINLFLHHRDMEDKLALWQRRVELCESRISIGSMFAKFWEWYRSVICIILSDIIDIEERKSRDKKIEIRGLLRRLNVFNQEHARIQEERAGMPRPRRVGNGKIRLLNR